MTVDWVRLKLDLQAFDESEFAPYLERCRGAGVEFTTMAELGDTLTHRRELYELNKTCAADIPERGTFYTFEEYSDRRFGSPAYDPHGVIVAVVGTAWVGMTATSLHHAENHAFSEMTGVLRSHRGRGLSLAMKTLAIGHARSSGLPWLRTMHHPGNVAAIAMNRRLGFVDDAPAP